MDKRIFVLLMTLMVTSCGGSQPAATLPLHSVFVDPAATGVRFSLESETFSEGGAMPMETVANVFGCTGGNQSPQLSWSGAPSETQSYAIVVHDPDAPTGTGFYHWLAFNIPASVNTLTSGASTQMPDGTVQSRTDYGASGWGGPCPPPGAPHHYVFTIYALDTENLGLDENASPAVVRFMLREHVLGHAVFTGTFGQ